MYDVTGKGRATLKESRTVFTGRIISLQLDRITLPNGAECELEIVKHPGGAAIVALDEDLRICMLHQYRYAAGGWIWELPAGKLEPQEPAQSTARRELQEEAGITARQWESLGTVLSSPGVFSEVIHLFLARGLTPTPRRHEAHEAIEVHWLPFNDAYARAASGEICDSKTLAGLLRAGTRLGLAAHSL